MKEEKGFLLPIIFIGVTLLLVAGAYYLGMHRSQKTPIVESLSSLNAEQLSSPLPKTQEQVKTTQWERTDFMGSYSFEYPVNWHVASQWPNEQGGPIVIGIDPKPISGAPRGGPLAAIDISDWNGLPAPEIKLSERQTSWKNAFKAGFKEEILQSELGQIYYYSGKLSGLMLEDTPMEAYVFLLPATTSSDKLNYRVIEMSSLNNSVSSEMLRQIALSFKRVR